MRYRGPVMLQGHYTLCSLCHIELRVRTEIANCAAIGNKMATGAATMTAPLQQENARVITLYKFGHGDPIGLPGLSPFVTKAEMTRQHFPQFA